jgi:hypothetical protein
MLIQKKNQHTKISRFSIYQQWTGQEWNQANTTQNNLQKLIKYLGINLSKGVKDLHDENYKKNLKKETEEVTRRW